MSFKYRVNEIFSSIQGEGILTGIPSTFVRLQGCEIGCPWCDEKPTWSSALGVDMTPESIRKQIEQSHIVITGGEPLSQDITSLMASLLAIDNATIQIETSGHYSIPLIDDTRRVHYTLSPKIDMPGANLNGTAVRGDAVLRANEIKFPVGNDKDIRKLFAFMDKHNIERRGIPVYLQPISQSKKATELCVNVVMGYGKEYGLRLSVQTHKYIGLD